MIISFSGIDGSGKSTQIELLRNYLKEQNKSSICIWSRVGYTPIFNFLKRILNVKSGAKSSSTQINSEPSLSSYQNVSTNSLVRKIWLILAMMDLAFYYGIYLRFLNLKYDVIICDRYIFDSEIDLKLNFQNEKSHQWILWKLLKKLIPTPRHQLLFYIDYEESRSRLEKKEEPFPESDEKAFHRFNFYTEEMQLKKMDGMQKIEEIHKLIVELISD